MKIEENMKLAKVKAEAEAKRKAAEEKAKAAEERRKKLAEEAKRAKTKSTT
jgi:hypothetical protein